MEEEFQVQFVIILPTIIPGIQGDHWQLYDTNFDPKVLILIF